MLGLDHQSAYRGGGMMGRFKGCGPSVHTGDKRFKCSGLSVNAGEELFKCCGSSVNTGKEHLHLALVNQ